MYTTPAPMLGRIGPASMLWYASSGEKRSTGRCVTVAAHDRGPATAPPRTLKTSKAVRFLGLVPDCGLVRFCGRFPVPDSFSCLLMVF